MYFQIHLWRDNYSDMKITQKQCKKRKEERDLQTNFLDYYKHKNFNKLLANRISNTERIMHHDQVGLVQENKSDSIFENQLM